MTRLPLPDRATFAALVSAKILLVGLMVIGAVAHTWEGSREKASATDFPCT